LSRGGKTNSNSKIKYQNVKLQIKVQKFILTQRHGDTKKKELFLFFENLFPHPKNKRGNE